MVGLGVLLSLIGRPASATEYHIGHPDVVRLEVYGKAELGGDYVVTPDGRLMIPFCDGGVPVRDMTVVEAYEAVRACLADGVLLEPQISLEVREYRSQKVEIGGAVKAPGEYYLEGPTTLRSLVGRAGGFELDPRMGAASLRRGTELITIPLYDLEGEPGTMLIRSGDVVTIRQSEVVLVGGQVANPGPLAYSEGLTCMQALLRAGDATGVANLAGSYVLRDGEQIAVNLRRIRKGRKADFTLQPGDTLFVPESPI